ncbi:MAG: hypothetical protein KAS23_09675, partial [Anaerohalosphaera sp.]|nr:hypothetical protein [Anaerohalosphaera sp.]
QTYTMYFQPGNHAIVYDSDVSVPFSVNGPLTAGFIPWGQGVFSYKRLSTARTTALLVQTEYGSEVHLTILYPNTPEIRLVLDPAKYFAVLSYELLWPGNSKVVKTYANLTLQGGRYIPMNIQIDSYDGNERSPKLLSSEIWEVISFNGEISEDQTFEPKFKEKALVEHHTSLTNNPAFHRHSSKADTKLLFDKRLVNALKPQDQKQNCSTASISHVLEELDVPFKEAELSGLIDEDTGSTNLFDMQEYIQSKGLYCKAVKTNIDKLRSLENCQVILHFPANNHFVVLDRFDEENAWIIDLSRQIFYDCMDLKQFRENWALGTALLISTDQNVFAGKGIQLPEPAVKQITGAGNYLCNDVIQEYNVINCSGMVGGECGGAYQVWYEMYACTQDSNGGYCSGTEMIGSLYIECEISLEDLNTCVSSGDPISIPIRACQQ